MASKILVVDDEAHLRRVVSLYLRARHYEVETAENGLDAIHKVSTDRPDLIIADIGMPGLVGTPPHERCRSFFSPREIKTPTASKLAKSAPTITSRSLVRWISSPSM